MIDTNKIKYLKPNRFEIYVKIFKSIERKSLLQLIAYLFDKELLFNKDFTLERIADRAGFLSLSLSFWDIRFSQKGDAHVFVLSYFPHQSRNSIGTVSQLLSRTAGPVSR